MYSGAILNVQYICDAQKRRIPRILWSNYKAEKKIIKISDIRSGQYHDLRCQRTTQAIKTGCCWRVYMMTNATVFAASLYRH